MVFGEKKRPISDFLPRILSNIDGVNADMVKVYTMDAIIQFLRDTKILTEIVCFNLENCVNSYKLHTSYRITEVMSVRFFINGNLVPTHKVNYRVEGDVFYVENPSCCGGLVTVEVELALSLPRDSEEVPDFLYEEWADAITAQTLSKLYLLTDNEWYNPQASANQLSLYTALIRQARFSKVTKHKAFNMRLVNKRRL